jgi:hypothetical protein
MRLPLAAVAALALAACGTVQIPDFEGCADLMEDGARCSTFISRRTRNLSADEFDEIRLGRISLSPRDYARLKASVEKICVVNRCTYEQQQAVQNARGFFKKLDASAKR